MKFTPYITDRTSKNVQCTGSGMIRQCSVVKEWQFVLNTIWNM